MQNSYALITGSTSGIGLECTKILAQKGYRVLLIGRSEEKLQRIKERLNPHLDEKNQAMFFVADLSKPSAADDIALYCRKKKIHIDVLIQAAGSSYAGNFLEMKTEKVEEICNVNILTLTLLSRHFGRLMEKREGGHILHISSLAAFAPVPFWAEMAASESYKLNFSQALSKELENKNVKVSCLAVGPTDTQFWRKAGVEDLPKVFPKSMFLHPKKVAKLGIEGLFKGKRLIVPGKLNRLVSVLHKLLPNTYKLDKLEKKQQDYFKE